MSACEHGRRLDAYHDGEMSPEERRRFEVHLRECPACADELERLRALSRILTSASRPAVPKETLARVHRRVGRSRDRVPVRLVEALTAAAAVVLMVCGWWLWRSGPASDVRTQPAAPWETVALRVRAEEPTGGRSLMFTAWLVEDLRQENGHD